MQASQNEPSVWHGTTILTVRKGGRVVIGGDGQVSIGQTVIKSNAKKVRKLGKGDVIGGFAGATADAFTLFERLESKLEQYPGQLTRAAVELAKDWRTDRYLRRLEAMMIVADKDVSLVLTGTENYLTDVDLQDNKLWKRVSGEASLNDLLPNVGNLTDSDARAIGVMIVLNQVDSSVSSYIDGATIVAHAGNVVVSARDNATISAYGELNVTASGGSFYGSGTVVAGGGQLVSNILLSEVDAYIQDADITATKSSPSSGIWSAASRSAG